MAMVKGEGETLTDGMVSVCFNKKAGYQCQYGFGIVR
jgi:hypothetical protein